MGFYGNHFALSKEQADQLCEFISDDEEIWEMFFGEEGPRWEKQWMVNDDKFWDGLHRCLTDGRLYTGTSPLHGVILGRDSWYEDDDYHVNVLDLDEVPKVLAAMLEIDKAWFRTRYDTLDQKECDWQLCDDDFEGHWLCFTRIRSLFKKAVAARRWVVFAANFC
jgi:hypothetical protein